VSFHESIVEAVCQPALGLASAKSKTGIAIIHAPGPLWPGSTPESLASGWGGFEKAFSNEGIL
jgi:hypothetical protein